MITKLYTTRQLIDMHRIPHEVAEDMNVNCPYCGLPMIRNWELTTGACSNSYCYGHMKYRADALVKFLNIKGIGPETCYKLMKENNLGNHFQVLPIILGEDKPKVYLWEIANMAFVPGYSTKWQDMLAGYRTFDDYFNRGYVPYDVLPYKSLLLDAQKYFSLKKALASNVIEVMLNGSILGYSKRDHFIEDCNKVAGHIVQVKLVGLKKSADYCVTMNKDSAERKVETAKSVGIPVMYPNEFLEELKGFVRDALL